MSSVVLRTPNELNFSAYAAFQQQAYAQLLSSSGVLDAFMIKEFYRLKYHAPAGKALITVLRGDAGYVSATVMIPLKIRCPGKTITGWQACDAASAPVGRGRGYFESLGLSEVPFAFSKANSVRSVIKLGKKLELL